MKQLEIAAVAGLAIVLSANGFGAGAYALPPKAVRAVSLLLPAAVGPLPVSGAKTINPVVSDGQLASDPTYALKVGEVPVSMTAVSRDGRAVELSVPLVKDGVTSYTNRWFRAEDVFGGVKWDLRKYTAGCQNLLYYARGGEPVDLAAKLPKGGRCFSLGSAAVRGTDYPVLVQPSPGLVCGVTTNANRIVLAREAPPVRTRPEYDRRVKELLSEYAFRQGRPWGRGFRPLLSWHPKHRRYACAAFTNDFAMYVFGKMYWRGEPFSDADDIRAGDYIRMDGGHKFIVLYRDGEVLQTIEGNMNHVVSRSKKRYSVKGGKLYKDGRERSITQAFHLDGGM